MKRNWLSEMKLTQRNICGTLHYMLFSTIMLIDLALHYKSLIYHKKVLWNMMTKCFALFLPTLFWPKLAQSHKLVWFSWPFITPVALLSLGLTSYCCSLTSANPETCSPTHRFLLSRKGGLTFGRLVFSQILFLKEITSAHQGSIYLIKNIVKR